MFRQPHRRSLSLASPTSAERRQPQFFRVGEVIPFTGIYRVFHSQHRVSHDVTLLIGETFPHCSQCGHQVHFELLQEASQIAGDSDFRVRLYEIPHPGAPLKRVM